MKKFILIFTITLATSILISSCKKDDDDTSPSELLTADVWTGTTATVSAMGYPAQTEDISNLTLEFLSDGTLNLYDDSVLQGSGTWSLSNDGTSMTISLDESIDIGGMDFDLNAIEVETLTDTQLTLTGTQAVNYQGFNVEVTYTASFVHD